MLVIELLSDMMKSLKVELHHLNDVRKIIAEKELMNMNYKIKTDKNYGYIPIKEIATPTLIEEIKNTLQLPELNITNCETELVATKHYPKSITEALKGKLNPTEIEELKKSFDTIGNIVILEIPEELEKYKKTIGEATLNFTKRTSVYMKKSPIEGVTRTRQLELIAGENNPVTIHKEHGTRLK
ncbi:MAG: class I SAM-dependent methyltransferase family protein, partial [Methanobacteriaceae archaeon]|nr:class I SAM-dependent methyltransferase family protein [Methanobacteriaceae archaeon]